MEYEKTLKELRERRDAIDEAILAFERLLLSNGPRRGRPRGSKTRPLGQRVRGTRGKKSPSAEAPKEVA